MLLHIPSASPGEGTTAIWAALLLAVPALAAPNLARRAPDPDPFAVLDLQRWVNPDNMTWADWRAPPGTNWSDPAVRGASRNFNIALVTVDYDDMPFTITLPAGSTVFSNPQQAMSGLTREEVPGFYRDFLNKPGALNKGHTLHE